MKIGKVFGRLAQDKRVKSISFIGEGQATVVLNQGFKNNGRQSEQVTTARDAHEFIRGAVIVKPPVEMITVTNLMSGREVQIPSDTPWACRPDSEAYWSA